jgi:hypothetical protein
MVNRHDSPFSTSKSTQVNRSRVFTTAAHLLHGTILTCEPDNQTVESSLS